MSTRRPHLDRPRIAVLGCGTVGSALMRALRSPDSPLSDCEVVGVAVRDVGRDRGVDLTGVTVTDDPVALAERDDVDVVVEAIGGLSPATEAIEVALLAGKDVVTANKAVIAEHGPRLQAIALASGGTLRYEAAAAASLPVVSLLRAAAAGDPVESIEATLSGTANFVLGELERGTDFDEAVRAAQAAGYAEADPSRDLDGRDTVDKLVLLARVAFGTTVYGDDVSRIGIQSLTPKDALDALAEGRRWKLVARATRQGCLLVEPRTIPAGDVLASAEGPGNVVKVTLRHGGELVLTGAGAGGDATASALLRDLGEALVERTPRWEPVAA